MGDIAFVYKSSFPEPVPTITNGSILMKQFVRNLKNIFDSKPSPTNSHYWEVDPAHAVTNGIDDWNATTVSKRFYLLLRATPQSWAPGQEPSDYGSEDPNLQQILIEGIDHDDPANVALSEILWATYAPKGGIDQNNFQEIFTPGTSFGAFTTGRISVGINNWNNGPAPGGTGGAGPAKRYYGRFNGNFYLAEYRDGAESKLPFSSLMILFEGGVYADGSSYYPGAWGCGLHAGRIFSQANHNDDNNVVENGTGIITNHASTGALASPGDGMFANAMLSFNIKNFLRNGNSWDNTVDLQLYLRSDPELKAINGVRRYVPFELKGGTPAAENTLYGYTKYIRQTDVRFLSYLTLQSKDPSSEQAWIGTRMANDSNDANYANHVVLWNKNVVDVAPLPFP